MCCSAQRDTTYLSVLQQKSGIACTTRLSNGFSFTNRLVRLLGNVAPNVFVLRANAGIFHAIFSRMRSNDEFARMNRPGGRQFAGIQMERLNADHPSIELGI
jgi:hypothetical protein